MKYSTNWLKEQIENEVRCEYLLFWGHTQRKDTIIDKSCFSQWYKSSFMVDKIVYPTAEHWMMAEKARLFNDHETLAKILSVEKPAEAKNLGREVMNFEPGKWASSCYNIVVEGNKHKFSQNDDLKNYLLQTKSAILVEASPVDTIWGIGLSQDSKDAANPFHWKGTNLLGFALMEVRDLVK
jgi:ribA/ribD-fused uncharacterized protein